MFSLSKRWKIILSSCMVTICTSDFSEAMQSHSSVEVLESGDQKIEVPSLFALLDPSAPCGLNLLLVEKRATLLHESGYFYNNQATREDVTVDIGNLRKIKRSPLYKEWQEQLAVLTRTRTYISTQVPIIIQNKLATIQNINTTLIQKETALQELVEQCQKSLTHIEKVKRLETFELSMKAIEPQLDVSKNL